jgi:hypothetical protein
MKKAMTWFHGGMKATTKKLNPPPKQIGPRAKSNQD